MKNIIIYFIKYFGLLKTYSDTCTIETKTNIMKTITIISTEEFANETVLFMSDGSEVKFETSKLIDYISDNELNVSEENVGSGLVCDPFGNDEYVTVVIPPYTYLDDNFDQVVNLYYNSLNK